MEPSSNRKHFPCTIKERSGTSVKTKSSTGKRHWACEDPRFGAALAKSRFQWLARRSAILRGNDSLVAYWRRDNLLPDSMAIFACAHDVPLPTRSLTHGTLLLFSAQEYNASLVAPPLSSKLKSSHQLVLWMYLTNLWRRSSRGQLLKPKHLRISSSRFFDKRVAIGGRPLIAVW